MNTDRKILVSIGALCVLGVMACIVTLGFIIARPAGVFALLFCLLWLGNAVAATLAESKDTEKKKP